MSKEKAFVVHKDVLSSASPKLAKLLSRPTDEVDGYSTVTLDIEEETCNELLRYIYNEKIGYISDKLKLLEASKKYEVTNLFKIMQHIIQLTVANVVEVLLVADRINAPYLKSSAINYINNHSGPVMDTDAWQKMVNSRPELLAQIYKSQVAGNIVTEREKGVIRLLHNC